MKNKQKFVVDTNLLISSILTHGTTPSRGMDKIIDCGSNLLFSIETFEEFRKVLFRKKFDRYVSHEKRENVLSLYLRERVLVVPDIHFTHCDDAKDNMFLDVAVAGQANYLITGDDDLLRLREIESIPIITMSEFLNSEKGG